MFTPKRPPSPDTSRLRIFLDLTSIHKLSITRVPIINLTPSLVSLYLTRVGLKISGNEESELTRILSGL